MTTTNDDTADDVRIAQMADALVAHLGSVDAASVFAARQIREADSAARTTWTALMRYLERYQDRY